MLTALACALFVVALIGLAVVLELMETIRKARSERDVWQRIAGAEAERSERLVRQLVRLTHPHRLQHPLVRVTAEDDGQAWASLIGGRV